MTGVKINYDSVLRGIKGRNEPQRPLGDDDVITLKNDLYQTKNDVYHLCGVEEDTRGRTEINRYLGVGAVIMTGLIGVGSLFVNQQVSGLEERVTKNGSNISQLRDRVAGIQREIDTPPADTVMIRNYALENRGETCDEAPSWYAIGGDCKTDITSYEEFVEALGELDLKGNYRIDNAHFKFDNSKDPMPIDSNTRPLESMLGGVFTDSGNDNGLIYWLENPNKPEPRYAPPTPEPKRTDNNDSNHSINPKYTTPAGSNQDEQEESPSIEGCFEPETRTVNGVPLPGGNNKSC